MLRIGTWLEQIAEAYGRPTAGGLEIPLSQRELAAALGISAGSVNSRLATAERRGLLVSRVPLVIRTHRVDYASTPAAAATATGEWIHLAARAAQAALRAGEASVADALLEVIAARNLRGPEGECAAGARDLRGPERELVSELYMSLPGKTPHLLTSSTEPATARTPRKTSQRPRGPHHRTRAELELLLEPLLELTRRRRLEPPNDWTGAANALSPYSDEQVAAGVRAVATRVRVRENVKSPIGWLLGEANRGSDIFAAEPIVFTPAPAADMTPECRERTEDTKAAVQAARKALRGA